MVTPEDIARTLPVIQPWVRRTPVLAVEARDVGGEGFQVLLKLELFQHSGSFKARGAFANLLLRPVPPAGVVAASGGNHGAAVAFAAMRRGVPAHIFVPSISSARKVERIRQYGAQLVVGGDRYADALAASEAWQRQSGALAVHAFDQAETLMGAGTLGVEVDAQVPQVDTVLVAVGGGGLLGGLAGWFRGRVNLVGVEPEGAPTLTAALAAGKPVDAPTGSLAADSLAPRQVGALMFPLAQQFVKRVVLVSDDDLRAGQRLLWSGFNVFAEPGGAAAFAALACGRYVPAKGERVVVVVSGGNGDLAAVG
jgi:threonine dehydratase